MNQTTMNNDQIEELLRGLDFVKIQSVMTFLNWKWVMNDEKKVPSVKEVEEFAEDMLRRFVASEDTGAMCGGFTLWRCNGEVSMAFEIDGTSVEVGE